VDQPGAAINTRHKTFVCKELIYTLSQRSNQWLAEGHVWRVAIDFDGPLFSAWALRGERTPQCWRSVAICTVRLRSHHLNVGRSFRQLRMYVVLCICARARAQCWRFRRSSDSNTPNGFVGLVVCGPCAGSPRTTTEERSSRNRGVGR
jgi:hypothetical protein